MHACYPDISFIYPERTLKKDFNIIIYLSFDTLLFRLDIVESTVIYWKMNRELSKGLAVPGTYYTRKLTYCEDDTWNAIKEKIPLREVADLAS